MGELSLQHATDCDWLVTAGQAGDLVRSIDWSQTPLGPRHTWPPGVRAIVNLILSSSLPMAACWGHDLIIIHNDAYALLLGRTHAPVMGRSLRELCPEIRQLTQPAIERVMASGKSVHLQDRLCRLSDPLDPAQAREIYCTLSCSPIQTDGGAPAGALLTVIETPHQVAQEQQPNEANERLQSQAAAILRSMPDEVWMVDATGRVTFISESVTRNLGVAPDHWQDIYAAIAELEILNPDRSPRAADGAPLARALRGEQVDRQRELVRNIATGDLRWREVSGGPLRDSKGAITGAVLIVRDITGQQLREAQLLQSEERLSIAKEAAALGIYDHDLITGQPRWDVRVREIWGIGPDEQVTYETIVSGVHPDDRPIIDKCLTEATNASGEHTYSVEYRVISRADGRQRWVLSTGKVFLENGRGVRLVGSVQDITDRKRAEESLRISERRLRTFFASDMVGAIYWTMDGRITDANDKFLRMMGYSREDLNTGGIDWAQMTPPEYRHLDERAVEELRATGVDTAYEKEYIRKDGTPLPIIIGAAMLDEKRDEGVAFVLDISARKQAEAALSENEQRFRALFDYSADAVLLTIPDGKIAAANVAACQMFGLTEQELCEAGREGLVDSADPRHAELGDLRRRQGWVVNKVATYVRSDGEHFEGETSSVILPGEPRRAFVIIRDVSERLQAQEALRLSEEKFLKAFAANPAAIAITRLKDGKYLEVNDTWVQSMGYSREEALSSTAHGLGIWPDKSARDRFVRELRERGALRGWELQMRRKPGDLCDIQLASQLLQINGEHVVLSTFIDVTDRKRAADALRDSEKRFRSVMEKMSEGLMLFDPQGNCIYQNPASLRILGSGPTDEGRPTREDLVATYEVWDEDGHPVGYRDWPVARVCRQELVENQVVRARRLDTGHEWIASYNGSAIFDSDGQFALAFITIRDITQQASAEQALRTSRQRLSLALDAIRASQSYWDMRTGELEWNSRAFELLGYEPGSFTPNVDSWRERIHPDDLAAVDAGLKKCMEQRKDFLGEYRVVWPDGSLHWLRAARRFEYDADGQPATCTSIMYDITDIKRAEERANAANQAKDHFLAVLSHELRTPLSPVLMTSAILENDPHFPAHYREDVATIRRNAEMEARLIDDLLDMTRIARGKVQLAIQEVRLADVLARAVETCDPDSLDKGVTVYLDTDMAAEAVVQADPARLQQVFWNLLKNSIKFTPRGGTITIRAATHADRCHPRVTVAVTDSGVGIPQDRLTRIFDAFDQGDTEVTRRFGGLGLGLAICRSLVEMHGGVIRASSDGTGKGATFSVDLPLLSWSAAEKLDSHAPAASQSRSTAAKPRARILLVEDHEATARTTARLLKGLGYSVQTAHSMASALELAEREKFDLLLSDLGLPDGSGHELLQELLKRKPISAIALSGYGMDSDISKSRQVGFREHLVKPVNSRKLEEAISRACSSHPTVSHRSS